jgi:hypothetical protein
VAQEGLSEEPHETRTFYVAAPGTGTLRGEVVKLGTFGLFAAIGGVPVALSMVLSHDAWLQRVLLFMYLAFLVYAWWYVVAHTRVHVGADGMRLVRHGKSRFLPIAAILGTNTSATAVTVFLDEALVGERQISLVSRRSAQRRDSSIGLDEPDPDIAVLASCIQSTIDDFSRARRLDVTEALARGDRSVREWVASLRELGEDPGYRTTPVARGDLWHVVEDATKPAAIRVAAAVALRPADDSERVRLRVQADTSAAAGFRSTLEAVLDSEGDIERRLQELEDE